MEIKSAKNLRTIWIDYKTSRKLGIRPNAKVAINGERVDLEYINVYDTPYVFPLLALKAEIYCKNILDKKTIDNLSVYCTEETNISRIVTLDTKNPLDESLIQTNKFLDRNGLTLDSRLKVITESTLKEDNFEDKQVQRYIAKLTNQKEKLLQKKEIITNEMNSLEQQMNFDSDDYSVVELKQHKKFNELDISFKKIEQKIQEIDEELKKYVVVDKEIDFGVEYQKHAMVYESFLSDYEDVNDGDEDAKYKARYALKTLVKLEVLVFQVFKTFKAAKLSSSPWTTKLAFLLREMKQKIIELSQKKDDLNKFNF